MYIIVVGGGRVGYYVTKALLSEGHEVVVIEKNPTLVTAINDEMGSICVRGDGCETATLDEVGTGRADMIIAVTGDDEDNLVSCQVAKHRFKVRRTIARIRNPKNAAIFKKLGIDVTVSSTDVILEHIAEEVPTHPLVHLMDMRDKGLELVEVRITREASTIGKAIKELTLPPGSTLALILRRDQRPVVPAPDTRLQLEDQIIAVTLPESEEALRVALRGV